MKGNDLMAENVSTAGEVGRKPESVRLSIELILLDPSTIALTNFGNLEPLGVRGIELVARNRAARS
jgi:hypothetical protein